MTGPLGVPRDEFIKSVRNALGRQQVEPDPPYPPLAEGLPALEAQEREMRQRVAQRRAGLLDRLAEVARLRGWQVCRTPDSEEAIGYIESVAAALDVNRVVRSDQEVFDRVPVDAALRNQGLSVTTVSRDESHSRQSLRQEIASAGVGITGADYAVAETGSVVLLPRKGLSRLVSLVPPVHIALVQPQEVLETLDDVFLLRRLEYYRQGGDMGSYLNFITGPSRTADIEQTIVVGVHGPKEVHLVLLG